MPAARRYLRRLGPHIPSKLDGLGPGAAEKLGADQPDSPGRSMPAEPVAPPRAP